MWLVGGSEYPAKTLEGRALTEEVKRELLLSEDKQEEYARTPSDLDEALSAKALKEALWFQDRNK